MMSHHTDGVVRRPAATRKPQHATDQSVLEFPERATMLSARSRARHPAPRRFKHEKQKRRVSSLVSLFRRFLVEMTRTSCGIFTLVGIVVFVVFKMRNSTTSRSLGIGRSTAHSRPERPTTASFDPPPTHVKFLPKTAISEKKKEGWIEKAVPTLNIPSVGFTNVKHLSNARFPRRLDPAERDDALYFDFGGLDISILEDVDGKRTIFRDYTLGETDFRDPLQAKDDDVDMYYAFDDDHNRGNPLQAKDDDVDMYYAFDDDHNRGNNEIAHDSDEEDTTTRCRRVSDHRLNLQNCNTFHESPLLEANIKYLAKGTYRQVFAIEHDVANETEKIVVKDINYGYDFAYGNFEFVRVDALVAERLTSSPRIYDIYGHCGLAILSELFPHGDMEYVAVPDEGNAEKAPEGSSLEPQNDLTALQKLQIALQMAEALADLHGNIGGIIVHQDMQLSQYLWNSDKSIVKLNDFNRAEFMLFDQEREQFCEYTEGLGFGSWRSPEEYYDDPLTEQVDVFSLGNNMYSLLSGLWPFYDEEDDQKIQKRIKAKETASIDPTWKSRSLAEGRLAEVIELCYAYEPDKRPSIFQVVALLRAAWDEVQAASDEGSTP